MKQALQLYVHIKKDQMLLAFILGLGLMGLQVGSFLWQHQLSAIAESGILLTGGWLIVAFLSLLLDQSRRLDVWLYTQRVSRGELFLSRVLLLVVLPIVVGFLVTIGMSERRVTIDPCRGDSFPASAAGVKRWPMTCRVNAAPTEKMPIYRMPHNAALICS